MLGMLALCLLAALCGAVFHNLYAPAPRRPALSADAVERNLLIGNHYRRYRVYVPAGLPPNAPLLLVLHGEGQDAHAIRQATGYGFERLADQKGFAVVYPEAFKKHWNDGRRNVRCHARRQGVDDKVFLCAVISEMAKQRDIDPARVFVFGYANGGHMAFRMAMEVPERVTAIAVVGASLPTQENSITRPRGEPVPALIVNGTQDPINPYMGGLITLFGFGDRGEVMSSRATAESFARLNHAQWASSVDLDPIQSGDATRVVRETWSTGGIPRVLLYSVLGGGHVIPQPVGRTRPLLGAKTSALDTPMAVCAFFRL